MWDEPFANDFLQVLLDDLAFELGGIVALLGHELSP